MKICLIAVFYMWVLVCGAQERKPITHETLWALKRLSNPQLSPDGKWVVYQQSNANYDEKENSTDLWIVAADGKGTARRLTSGKAGESGHQWSPNGNYLAFTAKREGDEVSQIYLLNLNGGEAQRFTNIISGASNPQWSPDGNLLLFTSSVWPGATNDSLIKKSEEDHKKIKYKARVYTGYPIRDWDHWRDEKQTHIFVQPLAEGSPHKDLLAETPLLNQAAGFSLVGAACFTPDSRQVVFAASDNFGTQAYQDQNAHLYLVGADGSGFQPLATDHFNYHSPMFSADGKFLICQSSPYNEYKVYGIDKLTRFGWPTMQTKTYLAPQLDRPLSSVQVKGNAVFAIMEDRGRSRPVEINIPTGRLTRFWGDSTKGVYGGLSVAVVNGAPVLASTYETATAPPEIVLINGLMHHNLSQANSAALSKLDLQSPETFWHTSKRGKIIRSMVIKPAGFDATKKYPLFVVMHGGPAGSWMENWGYRWNYHLLAAPGFVLVLTDYTGSTGYGEKFGQDIQYDPFKGPADEINEAAAEAIKRYSFIDGNRQAAGGASYGGHLASWMQATTSHYKCLINHAGLVNSEAQWGTSDVMWQREIMNGGEPWSRAKTWAEQNPILMAANFKTPMLLTVGEQDYRVPLNNTLENWAVHQRLKIPSKLIVFPEENHWILRAENSRFFYQQLHEWLKTYLMP